VKRGTRLSEALPETSSLGGDWLPPWRFPRTVSTAVTDVI
jgi:hypothetical protein